MPSFFASQEKQATSSSRPATSLLRRFNDLYKPSAARSSLIPSSKSGKTSRTKKTLLSLEQPVRVSLFPLGTEAIRRNSSGDSESNSSHSDASSSRQTLELLPSLEASPLRSPVHPHIKPLRPALKQTTSWNSTTTRSSTHDLHVSFVIPTRILDRSSRAPISYETLDEPATEPAVYSQLVLKCELFPWEVVVRPNAAGSSPVKSARFPFTRRRPVTNLDVLFALYDALSERVTEDEWTRLGHRSRAQRRISNAYEQRCIKLGGGWEAGVRRIDWLDGRTRLVGIEMPPSKNGSASTVATLVFKTPA
ncbi:hypothetical protein MVEN_02330700 [Mycena venus]|uniref:DUF6699 domain-containing protein n=1 Tax=Mycena venus TaxID=2733690 RepID=A0A8H6X3Y1_9AGAR|nr:hypothetical protein MVEN_02330700 [Mycena venus]